MDEIRIWNTARTEAQIGASMGTSLPGDEAGLVAYWNFDGTLDDLTANGIDLLAAGGDPLFDAAEHAPLGIVVALKIKSFSHDPLAGSSTITWSSSAGRLYHVESSENLKDWTGIGDLQGHFLETSFTDVSSTSGKKYYRVSEG